MAKAKVKVKLKSNRGAAKRFRKTASGFKCSHSFHRHILTKKSAKRKRNLRSICRVGKSDLNEVRQLLPHA